MSGQANTAIPNMPINQGLSTQLRVPAPSGEYTIGVPILCRRAKNPNSPWPAGQFQNDIGMGLLAFRYDRTPSTHGSLYGRRCLSRTAEGAKGEIFTALDNQDYDLARVFVGVTKTVHSNPQVTDRATLVVAGMAQVLNTTKRTLEPNQILIARLPYDKNDVQHPRLPIVCTTTVMTQDTISAIRPKDAILNVVRTLFDTHVKALLSMTGTNDVLAYLDNTQPFSDYPIYFGAKDPSARTLTVVQKLRAVNTSGLIDPAELRTNVRQDLVSIKDTHEKQTAAAVANSKKNPNVPNRYGQTVHDADTLPLTLMSMVRFLYEYVIIQELGGAYPVRAAALCQLVQLETQTVLTYMVQQHRQTSYFVIGKIIEGAPSGGTMAVLIGSQMG